MRRRTRFAIFVAAGIAIGIIIGTTAVYFLTRSEFGMARARGYALKWLDDRVNGELKIGRITGGGLLSGMTLHDFEIIDEKKRPFVHADSASLEYDIKTLLGGEIKLTRIKLWNPRLVIERLPGDTAWNYEHIFRSATPQLGSRQRKLIMFEDVQVVNATATVRQPFNGKPNVIIDTARSVFDDYEGKSTHVIRFDQVNTSLDRVIWESPIEKGRLFRIKSLTARGYIFEDPVMISRLEGALTTRDSITGVDFSRLEFGASRTTVQGRIIQTGGMNMLDLVLDGSRLTFKDLQWLYPRLPESGTASATLRIQTQRPKGVLLYASNARVTAPGTRMSGNFGVVMGDTLYFTDVDLRASPLNLDLLESLMPGRLPVDGLLVGTVEVKGPLSQLDTRGDLRLTRPNENVSSAVRWSGRFDARAQLIASGFKADLNRFDLALLNPLKPNLALRGVVSGRFEADGGLNRRLSFVAALEHELAGLKSRIEGAGSYEGGSRSLDLRFDALPISLDELAAAYPALKRFTGDARGPIRLYGPLDRLRVEAKLRTAAGELDFEGTLQRLGERPRYAGSGRMSGFQLDRLMTDLPATNITGKLDFDVTATSARDATGQIGVELSDALVQGIQLQTVNGIARLNEGQLLVDSARAETLLGRVNASGTIGLLADRPGELRFDLHSDSIAPAGITTATRGHLEARVTLRGYPGAFDLDGVAVLQRAQWGRALAQRGRVELTARGLGLETRTIDLRVAADAADLFGEPLDSARVNLNLAGGAGSFALGAASAERAYRATGSVSLDSVKKFFVRELEAGASAAPWRLQSPFQVTLHGLGAQADTFALEQATSGGSIRGGGDLAWTKSRADSVAAATRPLDFRLAFQRVPIHEYLRFYRKDASAIGWSDGTLRISGSAGEPIVQADGVVTDLRYAGTRVDRLTGSFAYAEHEVNARLDAQHQGRRVLEGAGRIPIDLGFVPLDRRKLDLPLEFSLRADSMPAALVTGLVRGFRAVEGSVGGTIQLRGTTVDPTIAGLLSLTGGSATYIPSGVRYRDVQGQFKVLNDSLVDVEASARAGEGRASVRGGLNFAELTDPKFDSLTVDATNFQTARRRDAEFTTTGRVLLTGRYRAPELGGRISVDRGALYLDELYRQYQVVELDRALLFSVVDTSLVSVKKVIPESTSPFLKNLRIRDLFVDVGRESWLRSRNLNVEVTGQLEIVFDRAAEDLRLTGALSAIRGTYQMDYRPITRRFEIRSGTVEFPGTPGMDPNLDIQTLYRARPLNGDPIDIIASVGGTLQNPRIRLSSDADARLSESDLASYLFFGVPTSALSSAQSRSLDAFNGRLGGFAGLGLNVFTSSGLGYLASGLQSFAQDVGLFDYVSLTAAEMRPDAVPAAGLGLSSVFANTQLEVGRYLGDNLFAVLSRRLASTTNDIGGRLEWRFHPTFTLEGFAEDRFARTPGLGIEQSTSFRKIYGLFLFREWSY